MRDHTRITGEVADEDDELLRGHDLGLEVIEIAAVPAIERDL